MTHVDVHTSYNRAITVLTRHGPISSKEFMKASFINSHACMQIRTTFIGVPIKVIADKL